jgi:hypothetical protein
VDALAADGTLTPEADAVLWEYLQRAALSMVNTWDSPVEPGAAG